MFVLVGYVVNNLMYRPSVSNAVGYTLFDLNRMCLATYSKEQVFNNCNQILGLAKSRRGITLSKGYKPQGLSIALLSGQLIRNHGIIVLTRETRIVNGRRVNLFTVLSPNNQVHKLSAEELIAVSRNYILTNAQVSRNSSDCPIACYRDCCVNLTPQFTYRRPQRRRRRY